MRREREREREESELMEKKGDEKGETGAVLYLCTPNPLLPGKQPNVYDPRLPIRDALRGRTEAVCKQALAPSYRMQSA